MRAAGLVVKTNNAKEEKRNGIIRIRLRICILPEQCLQESLNNSACGCRTCPSRWYPPKTQPQDNRHGPPSGCCLEWQNTKSKNTWQKFTTCPFERSTRRIISENESWWEDPSRLYDTNTRISKKRWCRSIEVVSPMLELDCAYQKSTTMNLHPKFRIDDRKKMKVKLT